jgi:prepilin peptidase CpaA
MNWSQILSQATLMWPAALILALYAGYIDWRTRRIPNWLTVSGFFLGIALNSIFGGWQGTVTSLEGAGLGLGLLLPLVLLRGFGAGDWKLIGAIGALMGWRLMLWVLIASILLSAAVGLIQIVLMRRVKGTFRNVGKLVKGFIVYGLRPHPEISLDNPTLAKMPFGTAVAAAMMLGFVLAHWPR